MELLRYSYLDDFNEDGSFHAVVCGVWDVAKREEATFGTLANRAQFDDDADRKIRAAQASKIIDAFKPIETKEDCHRLVSIMVYIMGRYF